MATHTTAPSHLGTQFPLELRSSLVCRVVGLPYGTSFSYTWTCPNGDCVSKVADGSDPYNYGRKIYNDSILAVNTTNINYGGTYTCQVTARGGQEATGSFRLKITGMYVCLALYCSSNGTGTSLVLHTHSGGRVVHSDHRIIPHQFLITSKHKILYVKKWQRHERTVKYLVYGITCTVSSGAPPPRFYSPNGTLDTGGVTQHQNAHSKTLEWDHVNIETLQNRDMYCDDSDTNYFYLYLTSSDSSE